MRSHMLSQSIIPCVRFATNMTDKRFLPSMFQHMLLQPMISDKSHSAVGAFLIFMPMRLPHMRGQIMFNIIFPPTNRAFKLVSYVMHFAHMFNSVIVMLHGFHTNVTLQYTFRMSAFHVISFRCLSFQDFAAFCTRETALFVSSLMHFQPFRVYKRFPAHIAYIIRVMDVQMRR